MLNPAAPAPQEQGISFLPPSTPAPQAAQGGGTNMPPAQPEPQAAAQAQTANDEQAKSDIQSNLEAHLNQIPDDQKQLLAEYLTPEFVRVIGIINGPEVAEYLAKFADSSKVLVPVPRQMAEQYMKEQQIQQNGGRPDPGHEIIQANGQPNIPNPQAPQQQGMMAPQGQIAPDGQNSLDARRIAALNEAQKQAGRPLTDEEKQTIMTMLNSNKNFSTQEIGIMAPNMPNKPRY